METAPRDTAPVRVRLKIRAITPRVVEIRVAGSTVWRGDVGERPSWIEFAATPTARGRLVLALSSSAAPVRENEHADARALGFAVYDVELK